jgi:hypothetical protein
MSKRAPSEFSATMIGVHDTSNKNDWSKQAYRQEAKQVASYLTGVHHARKLPAMQLNYSETVNKLSKLQVEKPITRAPPPQKEPERHSKNHGEVVLKQEAYLNKMRNDIKQETFVNDRKRRYNFSQGQTASIRDVFENKGEPPRGEKLFPQKATHLQVLALTGALKMPDANKLPPDVPRARRWLGDQEGWER